MSGSIVFNEIEQMFRLYRMRQLRLAALQPRLISGGGGPPPAHADAIGRPTEEIALDRTELAAEIERTDLVLRAMTLDEERLIRLRYFEDHSWRYIELQMRGWSKRQLLRLRLSVLTKAAWILRK